MVALARLHQGCTGWRTRSSGSALEKAARMQIALEASILVFPDSQTIWLLARTPAGGMQVFGQPFERAGPWVRQLWGSSTSAKPTTPRVPSGTAIPLAARELRKDCGFLGIWYEASNT